MDKNRIIGLKKLFDSSCNNIEGEKIAQNGNTKKEEIAKNTTLSTLEDGDA